MRMASLAFSVALVLALPSLALADEAADVVKKAIEKHGGESELAKHSKSKWKEKGTYHGMGTPLPYTGVYAQQLPDHYRMEIEGFFVTAIAGEKGWNSMQGTVTELTKEQIAEQAEAMHMAECSTLCCLLTDAYKLEVCGEEKVGEEMATQVKITREGKRDLVFSFGKDSGLLVATEMDAYPPERAGAKVRQRTVLSDHKEVDGLMVPWKMVITMDGDKYVEAEITEFEFVDELDEKLFAKP